MCEKTHPNLSMPVEVPFCFEIIAFKVECYYYKLFGGMILYLLFNYRVTTSAPEALPRSHRSHVARVAAGIVRFNDLRTYHCGI